MWEHNRSMLPLLLKRIGLDPATSSAPFVATLVDVTGIIIYFSMAFLFLGGYCFKGGITERVNFSLQEFLIMNLYFVS
jgi:hypothetical protein